MTPSTKRALSIFRKNGGILRTHEALEAGIHPRTLYALRDAKMIVQHGRGLFRIKSHPPLSKPNLVVMAKRVPSAIVCLVSALAIHKLTTQRPHAVQIALPKGARTPCIDFPPIEVFRFSDETLEEGVITRRFDNMRVRVFSPEKTLADVFKFRNRVGLDVALEALRNYARRKKRQLPLVLEFAKICRVESIMRPYLEALV